MGWIPLLYHPRDLCTPLAYPQTRIADTDMTLNQDPQTTVDRYQADSLHLNKVNVNRILHVTRMYIQF